jgi:hypothetical protein
MLTGKKPPVGNTKYDPPDALAKMKQANAAEPTRTTAGCAASQDKYKGLGKEDMEIADRLQKLKEGRKPKSTSGSVPTGDDLAQRLAAVRGQSSTQTSQPFVCRPDTRSQQEQVDSLLEMVGNEVHLDSRMESSHIQNIETRLNRLRDRPESSESADGVIQNNLNKADSKNIKPKTLNISGETGSNVASGGGQDDFDLTEVNRLMQQTAANVHGDARQAVDELKKDKDLWNRVNRLKTNGKGGGDTAGHPTSDDEDEEDSEDEEAAARKVCKQIMAEMRLDEACPVPVGAQHSASSANSSKKSKTKPVKDSPPVEDELPWCCICNNDATLRCVGCDNDLYCQRCFREGHDRFDMKDGHKAIQYKQLKNKS